MALIDDLISYYKLDETSGSTATDSHGSNNGTYIGNLPNAVTGIINNAQDTAAQGDRINLGSDASIDDIFDGGGSIAFWTNFDSLTNYSGGGGGFRQSINKVAWMIQGFDGSGRYLELFYSFSTTDGTWSVDGTPFSINEDIFIVITYDNSSVSNDPVIYLNGSAASITEASTPSGTRNSDAGSDMHLMSDDDGDRTIDGWQDETGIWDRILTSDEVSDLYNNGNGLAYEDFTEVANPLFLGAGF